MEHGTPIDHGSPIDDGSPAEYGSPLDQAPFPQHHSALVGRDALLAGIAEVLRGNSFSGVHVLGGTGSGKSVLARTLIEDLQEEFAPFHLTPAAVLATVPYGALTPLLEEATSADLESSRTVLRAVLAFVRRTAGPRPVLVVVDDAHLLDESSGYVLAQLTASRAIRLAAFARPGTPVSAELVTLTRDGLVQEFELTPLTSADTLQLGGRMLGGALTLGAGERFRTAASGNPLLLTVLLEEAVAAGTLEKVDGVWFLAQEQLPVPRALVDFLRSILLGLSEPERKAFELLALGEAFSFQELAALSSEDAVAVLFRDGLIRRCSRYPVFAVLSNPLFARITRTLVPMGRSAALLDEVGERTGNALPALPPYAEVRRAVWRLECGRRVPTGELLGLAGTAASVLDPDSALRLLEDAGSARSPVARVLRATALLDLGRLDESRKALTGVLDSAADPEVIAAAGILEVRQLQLAGTDGAGPDHVAGGTGGAGPAEADAAGMDAAGMDTAGEIARAVEAITERWGKALDAVRSTDPDSPAVKASEERRTAIRAVGWNHAGRYMDALSVLEPLLVQDADATAGLLARALMIEALGALGRSSDAAACREAAVAQLPGQLRSVAYLARELTLRSVQELVSAGRAAAAQQVIEDYAASGIPSSGFLSGSLAALRGALEIRSGRFAAGLGTLRPAVTVLRRADPDGLLPYALGLTAWAAAVRGATSLAVTSAQDAECAAAGSTTVNALLGRAFAAAADALLDPDGNSSAVLELAVQARRRGWITCEKDILGLAFTLGNSQAGTLLLQITGSMQGPEAGVLSAAASALAAGDAAALAAAGDRAEALELPVLAADACRRAMELYAVVGDVRSQRLLAPVFRRRRLLIEGALFAELGEEAGGAPLTSREREIAVLTLRGFSNRDIAEELTVSVRTVEGHLYRIFVKLGITRREELTAELEPSLLAM